MKVPPYLKPGDRVALVAPARRLSREELEPAMALISQKGFVPVPGKYVEETYRQFAGTDEQRAADLQWALDDPEIKAVISVRGGYGCLRIIDRIDWTGFTKHPKWLVGYSDVTVFHSHVFRHANVATLHATMPINFFKSAIATESLFSALTGQTLEYRFSAAGSKNPVAIQAPVVGGNLSLLYALQGSATDLDTRGTILFLEDLDEYLYHIDRMMISLKRSGKLAGLKALLIGGFTDMKDNAVPFGSTAHEIILDAVREYDYPVYFHFPAGHQDDNRAIQLGMTATLQPSGDQIIFRQ